jgi:Protein of unknown function (DUF1552)
MMISKKALSRRTILRGISAGLALPLLDSMVPALSAFAKSQAAPVNRFGVIYQPNGMNMSAWLPTTEGAGFEFTPTMKPLEPFRDRMLVLSGLNSGPQEGTHARASTHFLTDSRPHTKGVEAGVSMDQIAASHSGQYTQLGSLEICLEPADFGGAGDADYSRVYIDTISWRRPTTPLPMENNPRIVFERMFGDNANTDPAKRLARIQEERSILDSVAGAAADLQRGLGPNDRVKLTEFFDSIRDVERRIQKAEEQNANELPSFDHPAGIPGALTEHVKLMYDLQVLAYQCDLTRVVTFMLAHELSGRPFPEIGVPDAHHAISHHQGDPERLAKLAKIDQFNVSLFSYFVEKLRTTPDGDGSLLDHSIILYGAGMSDGNAHSPINVPIALLGGGCGTLKGGRHIRFKDFPLANLHINLLDKLGVHVEKIGDSSGELPGLAA